MQIDLFCVGKQDRQFAALVEFYSQRIKHYANLEVNELEVKNIRDEMKRHQLENEKLVQLLTKRNKSGFVKLLACDPRGEAFSSEQMANKILQIKDSGQALGFIVGGSRGLNERVLGMCTQRISFSCMTFPHQLFRVMLLEQVYRGLSIIHGAPYHKA